MKYVSTVTAYFLVFASILFADEKQVTTLNEALARSTSFSFKSEPFESAVLRLTKQVQTSLSKESSLKFDIKILGDDLKLEGITRNQTVRDFAQDKRPLRTVLTALVQKANPNNAVKGPSEPGQKLVWVVGPDPDHVERQVILITTRQMAKERSYKLPDEFAPKVPSP